LDVAPAVDVIRASRAALARRKSGEPRCYGSRITSGRPEKVRALLAVADDQATTACAAQVKPEEAQWQLEP
jgi:hypothetical protein